MSSLLRFNAASTARNRPLTGDTKSSFVLDDHLGWLKCDGRGMDRVTFNLLFQVIGYQFGGSGNTFNLPNLQGRVMGNTGFVRDEDNRTRTFAPGESVGELGHKLTVNEMPAHNHSKGTPSPGVNTTADGTTSSNGSHSHTYTDAYFAEHAAGGGVFGTSAGTDTDNNFYYRKTDGSYTTNPNDAGAQLPTSTAAAHSHTISSNGNDEYHNNIQPTLFYGNTFIYSGVPITKSFPFLFPFTTGRNPVLI